MAGSTQPSPRRGGPLRAVACCRHHRLGRRNPSRRREVRFVGGLEFCVCGGAAACLSRAGGRLTHPHTDPHTTVVPGRGAFGPRVRASSARSVARRRRRPAAPRVAPPPFIHPACCSTQCRGGDAAAATVVGVSSSIHGRWIDRRRREGLSVCVLRVALNRAGVGSAWGLPPLLDRKVGRCVWMGAKARVGPGRPSQQCFQGS